MKKHNFFKKLNNTDDDNFEQYFYSNEEVKARENAYETQIDVLSEDKKGNKKEIKELKSTIRREKFQHFVYNLKQDFNELIEELS